MTKYRLEIIWRDGSTHQFGEYTTLEAAEEAFRFWDGVLDPIGTIRIAEVEPVAYADLLDTVRKIGNRLPVKTAI